jgi:hypothetical protein
LTGSWQVRSLWICLGGYPENRGQGSAVRFLFRIKSML